MLIDGHAGGRSTRGEAIAELDVTTTARPGAAEAVHAKVGVAPIHIGAQGWQLLTDLW